ncbi:hypothetical protein HFD88_003583 [Aspergillus terreus]|nr:hypothetical protein HFD88_003583 [Aspergillus terreus]
MENFHILDPMGDLLVVVKKPSDLCEDNSLVLDLVTVGEDAIPGYLQYEPSQPSSSDNDSTSTDPSGGECSYTECARFLVSSKHLSLGSSYLSLELCLDENACTKKMKVPACVQDVYAVWILFSILHCRANNVPRAIDLKMLISITALVQYFDCVEAVQLYAHFWIDRLIWPIIYIRNVHEWIWIARIYRHDALFAEATRIAIRESTGPLDLTVLDTIETLRQEAIDAIVAKLYDRIEVVKQGKYCCGECDALILERLIPLLQGHGLYPRPVPPFQGISIDVLVRTVAGLQAWSFVGVFHTIRGCDNVTAAVVGTDMQKLEELCEQVQGLSMEELNNA